MKDVLVKVSASIDGCGEVSFPIHLRHLKFNELESYVKMVAKDILDCCLDKKQITDTEYADMILATV